MNPKLEDKLLKREKEGTMRSLSFLDHMVDFYSNDYLGLAQFEFDHEAKGSSGSRLLSGNSREMQEIEEQLAQHFGADSALFFGSGYLANLGFFSCVPQRGEVVLYDEEIHASIRDGLRMGLVKSYSFRHNDLDHLESLLKKETNPVYIAVEGLYSMSGTFCDLIQILDLAKRYNAQVVIDEAHSAGISGMENKGLSFQIKHPNLLARIVTFGKAYGAHGSVVLVNKRMQNYLVNFCRPFIYTTAPPLSSMQWVLRNTGLAQNGELWSSCQRLIELFRSQVSSDILVSDKNSPIQMLRFNEEVNLNDLVAACWKENLACKAIFPPTVAPGQEGLRINLHSFNSEESIKKLVAVLP